MPQGKDFASSSASAALGVHATKGGYERKPKVLPGGPVRAPKTERAAQATSQAFQAALGGMTRNFEMIAAGKLIAAGSALRMGDFKRAAEDQLEMQAKAKKVRAS